MPAILIELYDAYSLIFNIPNVYVKTMTNNNDIPALILIIETIAIKTTIIAVIIISIL